MRQMQWMFKEQWGFERVPQVDSFEDYFKAIMLCAAGDGELDSEERKWIIGYANALGAPDSMIERLVAFRGDASLVDLIRGRIDVDVFGRALIYDAIRACAADGDLHPEERKRIDTAAETLGLDRRDVRTLLAAYTTERAARHMRIVAVYPGAMPY